MRTSKFKLIAWVFGVLSMTFSYANVIEQETFLSNHLTDIIKSYDTRGVVRVDIELKDKKVELPGTNFIVNSNFIGELDKRNVKSVTVNVFSELSEIPSEFKTYIDNKTSKLTKNSQIKFIQLEKQVNSLESKITNGLEKLSTKMGGNDNLLYALAAIPFAIILIAFLFRGQLMRATDTMGAELQSLTSALQEQGIGTSMDNLSIDPSGTSGSGGDQSSTILEQSMWENMNEEFYTGLLTDCYWCHEDEYASFVWSKAPVEMKRSLKESEDIDYNYVRFVSNLPGTDLGYGQHSYYLNPWKYYHVSNEDLGEMVKEDKRLFKLISPMRLTKIHLTLEEKLECIQMSSSNMMTEELFTSKLENIEPSLKRELDNTQEFEFASFEEEDQLMAMDVDYTIMKKFPSLGWILKLDQEKATEILSKFQARDLASCLYTSDSIKEQILNFLPEKRRELIKSYLERTPASKNKSFALLMEMIYSELDGVYTGEKVVDAKSA